MPSRPTGGFPLLALAGLVLLTSSGCMDFAQAVADYCARHPTTCSDAGTPTAPPPPATDLGQGPVRQISARGMHTLALTTDGVVLAWGQNSSGQLGDGTTEDRGKPQRVLQLSGMERVAAGYTQSLALRGGEIWSWGKSGSGSIQKTPAKVAGLDDIVAISVGASHALALKQTGEVWTWGNDNGGHDSATPVRVEGLPAILPGPNSIVAGNSHSLALDTDGAVWAWGDNSMRQLGTDTVQRSVTPVRVAGLPKIQLIAVGNFHSLALDMDGRVWTWGNNDSGQLGDGTRGGHRALPQQVAGLTSVRDLAAGNAHSLALSTNNNIFAWGSDSVGQLGDDVFLSDQLSPAETDSLTNADAIAAGHSHSVALLTNRYVFAWGSNSHGQLGTEIPLTSIPVLVLGP